MDKEERSCFPKKTKEEQSLPSAAILDSVDMERAEVLLRGTESPPATAGLKVIQRPEDKTNSWIPNQLGCHQLNKDFRRTTEVLSVPGFVLSGRKYRDKKDVSAAFHCSSTDVWGPDKTIK